MKQFDFQRTLMRVAILMSVAVGVMLPSATWAQNCAISVVQGSAPAAASTFYVNDCDGSGTEVVSWTAPTATTSGAPYAVPSAFAPGPCGAPSITQTGGPANAGASASGNFVITYLAQAVDVGNFSITTTTYSFNVSVQSLSPTAGGITASQTICNGATPAALTSTIDGTAGGTNAGATVAYEWQSSPNGTTWTTIGGATGNSYAPGALTATTHYRRITVATFINGTACSRSSSPTPAVTVLTGSSTLSYTTSTNVYTEGTAITPNTATVTGTAPFVYTVSSLPAGLSINSTTGEISGTPTAPTVASNYTVIATNSCATTATLNITINAIPFVGGACSLLNEAFTTNPQLANTDVDGAWYPDRYRPASFTSDGTQLKIAINAVDGAQLRPSGYTGAFYNTQGRKINQCSGCVTVAKADLYIPADWATNKRRSDLWATAFNASNEVSAYPIIGFRNVTGASPQMSVYNIVTAAWNELGAPSLGYNTSYTLEARLNGANLEYLINNVVVATYPSGGSVYFGNIIMQAYNFNDNSLGASYDDGPNNSYDATWDNLITSSASGNIVTNTSTGSTHCSIQAAINAASSGNVITVSAGIYVENVVVNKRLSIIGAGSSLGGTIVQGVGGTGIVFVYQSGASGLSGNPARLEKMYLTGGQKGVYLGTNDYINLDDLDLVGLTTYGVELFNNNNIEIKNSIFTSGASGIRLGSTASADGLLIDGCSFSNNSEQGIHAFASATGGLTNVTITNNNIANCGVTNNMSGMYFEKLSNANISNNTLTNNGLGSGTANSRGIVLNLKSGAYSNVTISDNVITENRNPVASLTKGYGVYFASGGGSPVGTLSGVTVTSNEIDGFWHAVELGAGIDRSSLQIKNNKINNRLYELIIL